MTWENNIYCDMIIDKTFLLIFIRRSRIFKTTQNKTKVYRYYQSSLLELVISSLN